jgi:hypothetical protein
MDWSDSEQKFEKTLYEEYDNFLAKHVAQEGVPTFRKPSPRLKALGRVSG